MDSPPSYDWSRPPDGPAPLTPTILWGQPTDVVPLYDGPMRLHGAGQVGLPVQGSVRMLMRSGTSVVWDVDLEDVEYEESRRWHYGGGEDSDFELSLEAFPGGATKVPVFFTGDGRGIVTRLSPGPSSPTATTVRAVSFCLPTLFGAAVVVQRHADEGGSSNLTGQRGFPG